jgi:predicted nucleotidyltransferase
VEAPTNTIRRVFAAEPAVVFAYLHGSCLDSESYQDIDIAVFATPESDPFRLSVDLRISLSEKTGLSPEKFDIRIINHLLERGDMFALLFLRDVLNRGRLLVDNRFEVRAAFVESFGMKYRLCEGLIGEVLA